MKVDELLKHLENVKIDENIDEKREITEYLAQTLRFDDSPRIYYRNHIYHYIITRDKKIYKIQSYKSYGISPCNAYVYIRDDFFPGDYHPVLYYYPFLSYELVLLHAYLSKLGLDDNEHYVVPATGLKYVSMVIRFMHDKRVVIEVADINTVATNLNLPTLVHNILGAKLGTKYIDVDKYCNILFQLGKQKFFAGYTFYEAREIINRYYEVHDTTLAKDVVAIRYAYNRIFQPYRIEYNLETKQFQVSGNNESK
jgi:hypothetical protein